MSGCVKHIHLFFRHGLHGLTRFFVYVNINFFREIRVIRA